MMPQLQIDSAMIILSKQDGIKPSLFNFRQYVHLTIFLNLFDS